MITSKRLRITPLTLVEFKKKYNISTNGIYEYYQYLVTHTNIHHYNGLCLSEWYQIQTKTGVCNER